MLLSKLYDKLGKQTVKALSKQESYVYVNGNKYLITNIKYENGKAVGFEAISKEEWFSANVRPEPHVDVIVRDEQGKEYTDHQWNGTRWYAWSGEDGWPTDVNVMSWRY